MTRRFKGKLEFSPSQTLAILRENENLKALGKKMTEDPQGVIQPFLVQYETALQQNNRLSALVAALIDRTEGNKLQLPVGEMERFVGKRISLRFELNGEPQKPETLVTFTYTTEAAKAPTVITSEVAAAEPVESVETAEVAEEIPQAA